MDSYVVASVRLQKERKNWRFGILPDQLILPVASGEHLIILSEAHREIDIMMSIHAFGWVYVCIIYIALYVLVIFKSVLSI